MVQLIILALSGICLLIGVWRLVSPAGHLEGAELDKHKKEAIKLIGVSAVAAAVGMAISFV